MQIVYAKDRVVLPAAGTPPDIAKLGTKFDLKGRAYLSVPHTPQNALAMRDVGLDVKVPIDPAAHMPLMKGGQRRTPFKHQIATTRFMVEHPRAFVLNEAGLGKTASAIWAWHYLYRAGRAGRLVIFCPKTIMESAWYMDFMATFPGISVSLVQGTAAVRDKIIRGPSQVLVINHDGVLHNQALRDSKIAGGITHVIVDEGSAFNRYNSERSKKLRKFVQGKACWVMTATPISHAPDRAWALAQLVEPANVDPNYFTFRERTMRKPYRGAMGWEPRDREEWEPAVHKALSPAIRFTKDDCLDLPPQLVAPNRLIDLTPEQEAFAKALERDWFFEDQNGTGTVSAVNAAARLSKLLQCYQGAVRRDDGTVLELPYGPRLDAVCEIAEEAEGKVILFVQFVAPLKRLVADLRQRYGEDAIAGMYGATTTRERAAIVKSFQDPTSPLRVLVAHPETASHGLTLTEANVIIWFGSFFKSENYAQANERMRRPGQTRSMTIHHLVANQTEAHVFAGLQARLTVQDLALSAYQLAMQR